MLSCGVSLLYSGFGMAKDKREARLRSKWVAGAGDSGGDLK